MPYAELEFTLPEETEMRRQVLYPYSMKDASQAIDENRGAAYFVPHGFQPILVPLEGDDATLQRLLDLSTPAMPVAVPLRQTLLPHYVIRPTKRVKTTKQSTVKGPPRPPNAFILYRKNQQAHILQQNAGLCNNDVSRIIGSMWNGESPAVKQRFHLLAQEMKERHRAMYPMYRYCPRKAPRRKRRSTTKDTNNGTFMDRNIAVNIATTYASQLPAALAGAQSVPIMSGDMDITMGSAQTGLALGTTGIDKVPSSYETYGVDGMGLDGGAIASMFTQQKILQSTDLAVQQLWV